MKKILLSLSLVLILFFQVHANGYAVKRNNKVYKEIDGIQLEMTIYTPLTKGNAKLPAIIFFFGGGWESGTPDHFMLQAEYLASRGIVAVCPDYRIKNRHGTTPFESVKDARSAMRFLKINGTELGIDTSRIVASGGSAGGHLASCTALIGRVNEESDDLSVSTTPFALVLFNPVVDTSKRGYGQEKLEGREFEISPVHHITNGVPPTLVMHGKEDTTVPYENVERFEQTMKQAGNECRLVGYKNQTHGFFNYSRKPKYFKKTLRETEIFLEKFQLLRGESWLNKYCKML